MATAGSIVIDLLVKSGSFETDMDRAAKRVKATGSEFDKAAAAVRTYAMAAGLAAAAFASSTAAIVMSAAKAMDATSKMAQQIGVTTEALTGMRFAAQQFANISDQQFDMSMRRMTRRIEEAAAGGGAAKKALEEMGLSAQELSRMTPDRQMLALADAMKRTESQANRLRYTMAIFDTEGMALVPALQQGAAAFEENIRLAERYGVVLSTEAARAAEEFNTNLSHLGSMLDGLKIRLASEVLPTINQFVSNVIQAATEVDGLHTEVNNLANDGSFKSWFESALVGLSRVADVAVVLARLVYAVGGSFQVVGADIEAFVAMTLRNIENLNPASIFDSTRYEQLLAEEQRVLESRSQILEDAAQRWSDVWNLPGNKFEQAALSAINTIRLQSDAVKLVDLTVQNTTKSLDKKSKKLTETQKAAEAFRKEQERALVAQYQSISAIHAQAQGIEDQVALFGLSKSALEDLTIARLEEEAVVLRMYGDRSKDAVEAIEREIEARKRLRTAMGSLEQKEAEKAAWDAWARDVEQVFQQVGQSLTDAIFDGGKSGLDLLKDWAKTLTLRIFVQPVMSGLQAMVTGVGPGGIAAGGSAAGGLMGSPTSLFSMFGGNSMGMGISNALTGLSSSSMLAGTGVGNWMTGVAGNVAGMSNLALGGAGLLGGLGANLIFGGKGHSGIGGGLGSTVGMALGGPLGAVAGSLIGGGLGSLFGDREPTTRREQRTQVEYAGGVFDVTKVDDRAPAGADAAARALAEQAVSTANEIFKQVGVDAAIDSFHAIMASSYQGDRDGVASGGMLRLGDELRRFGIANEGNPTLGGFGGWSSADTLPRLATDIQLSVLEAFQSISDQLPNVLSGMLEGVDVRSLGEQEAQALAERFTLLTQGASQFLAAIETMPFEQLRDLSFDAAAGMVQFAGGIDNLLAAQQTYYERFYSDAERHAHSVGQLSEALAGVGVEMPALVGSTDDMLASYRALVESLDLNTEAGQQAYVTLMQTAGAFAEVAQFAGQAALDMERAAEDQRRAAEQARQQALSDLSTAYNAVVQAGQREIARLQESFGATDSAMNAYRSAVQRLESEFNSLFSVIDRGVQALRGTGAAFDAQYHQARAVISTTLLTGQLPQTADLSEAIRVAQQGVMGQRFASREDQQRAYLTLANEMEAIKEIAGPELDTAQATLAQLEDQYRLMRGMSAVGEDSLISLEAQLRTAMSTEEVARHQVSVIEQQLEEARRQYDALTGIDTSIKDLATAMREFASATAAAAAARTAVSGGGGGGGGGGSSLPANSTAPGSLYDRAREYYAANPDVAAVFNRSDKGYVEFAMEHYNVHGKNEGRKAFDIGTSYVPYDMTADIHRGEIIIDPRSSDILRRYGIGVQGGGSNRETEQLLREQLSEVRQQNRYLYEIVKSGKRTANNTEDTATAIAHGDSDGVVVVM